MSEARVVDVVDAYDPVVESEKDVLPESLGGPMCAVADGSAGIVCRGNTQKVQFNACKLSSTDPNAQFAFCGATCEGRSPDAALFLSDPLSPCDRCEAESASVATHGLGGC